MMFLPNASGGIDVFYLHHAPTLAGWDERKYLGRDHFKDKPLVEFHLHQFDCTAGLRPVNKVPYGIYRLTLRPLSMLITPDEEAYKLWYDPNKAGAVVSDFATHLHATHGFDLFAAVPGDDDETMRYGWGFLLDPHKNIMSTQLIEEFAFVKGRQVSVKSLQRASNKKK